MTAEKGRVITNYIFALLISRKILKLILNFILRCNSIPSLYDKIFTGNLQGNIKIKYENSNVS